jgi:hypothetical protein
MRGLTFKLLAVVVTAAVLFVLTSVETCACGPKYPLWQWVIRSAAHQFGYELWLPKRDL